MIDDVAKLSDITIIFSRILNFVAGFAVLAAFIMLVIGGFKFLTSGGDSKAVESARNTITYAIIGLVALVGIWLILKFIEIFTGVPVTKFQIPSI